MNNPPEGSGEPKLREIRYPNTLYEIKLNLISASPNSLNHS